MASAAPRFEDLELMAAPLPGEPPELDWLADALAGRARAVWWSAPPGLVAPLSYRRHAALDAACADFAAKGWPVRLRRSGGGVVPQGPGIAHLSLAYPVCGAPAEHMESAYRHLCGVLGAALARLGIAAHAAEVAGSFCDGRWNLAVARGGVVRKIAGTAQYWKRTGDRHAVLAHALLLVDADTEALTGRANDFETALASGRRYEPGAVTSVAREWREVHAGAPPSDLAARLAEAVATALGQRRPASSDATGPAPASAACAPGS